MARLGSALLKSRRLDQKYLKKTAVPLVTVSGTYREDLKGLHDLPEDDLQHDLVFSRAHYSMTIGAAVEAWGNAIDPKKAWIVDPTNYVAGDGWTSVVLTEKIGKLLARNPILKLLKDFVDKFGRQKLPILASITPPLKKLTREIKGPVLSFHIAAGNIMLDNGQTILQVITDPHVREDYIANGDKDHAFFAVFDEMTKEDYLKKAHKLGKKVDENRLIITGPPIDPRVLAAQENKKAWSPQSRRPLRLCLTTGGIGTNKQEIKTIVEQLIPELMKDKPAIELMVYAGTHSDIKNMVVEIAQKQGVKYQTITPPDPAEFEIGEKLEVDPIKVPAFESPLIIMHHPQIIDANELLIHAGFPWADGFITKPSGDMAYDSVASGAFLLTLKEWGEWEHNIRAKFESFKIAQVADSDHIDGQLNELMKSSSKKKSWITQAMHNAREIEKQDPYFRQGNKNIIKAFKKLKS